MWNEFKNKIKHWFNAAPEETEDQPETNRSDSSANTKMTYKYPKSGEFRFPVIPDQKKDPGPSSPRYETRVQRRESSRREVNESRKGGKSETVYDYTEPKEKQNTELPETSSRPFTPTDVPSPIYGYRQREQKTSHVVVSPTYDAPYMKQEKEWQELRRRLRGKVEPSAQKEVSRSPYDEEKHPSMDRVSEVVNEEAATLETEKVRPEQPNELSAYENHDVTKEDSNTEDELVVWESSDREKFSPPVEETSQMEVAEEDTSPVEETSQMEVAEEDTPPVEETSQMEIAEEDTSPVEEPPQMEVAEEDTSAVEETSQMEVAEEDTSPVEETSQMEVAEEDTSPVEESPQMEETEEGTSPEEEARQTEVTEVFSSPAEGPSQAKVTEEEKRERPNGEDRKPPRSQEKSVPFNVIMTPRDKRTRDQKSVQPKVEKEEATNTTTEQDSREEHKSDRNHNLQSPASPIREEYEIPFHLLDEPIQRTNEDETWIRQQMELLETTLRHFHVKAKVINAMRGPTVTRFEVQPEPGVKVSKITNLADDIKLSMAAKDIRIEAPIPGKQAVGIEVPNVQSQVVGLQELFESEAFTKDTSPLSVGLGLDIGGDSIVTNLKKMPHGLIAGATGSGKSVCINTILISLLYKAHHEDVKFLLIDPKMVELAPYNGLPHLVSPVITDVKAATTALKWAVKEMEERYEKFVEEGVRDVERYNEKMVKQQRQDEKLPYLVIVIDELADLMMVSPQDVEDAICRIAQKARACGIHLLLATQRPSVDVITGLIKANIPTRIAFSVSSQVDSRTILDSGGAEKLLGKGDMLFIESGSGQSVRIQGAFVSDDEIERVTNYVKKIAPPQYLFEQEELIKQSSSEEATDELFDDAVQFIVEHNGASASLLQRRFKVGYNRAARLIDQMEEFGIISEQKGSKPRDILLTQQQIQEIIEAKG